MRRTSFLTVDLAGSSPPVVFRRQEILDATDEILSDEGVRKQYSDDLEKRVASGEMRTRRQQCVPLLRLRPPGLRVRNLSAHGRCD